MKEKLTKKQMVALGFNLFIGIMTFVAWGLMAILSSGGEDLAARGFHSLKFYTVLSNLFNGVVCLLYSYWILRDKKITVTKRLLKLTATTVVGVTFLTVMVFLSPLYGFINMIQGANLWLHLVLPVMAILSFVLLEDRVELPWKKTAWVMLFTILYEIGYLGNIFLHGVGTWPDTNDFYGFLNWGNGVGAIIAVVILLGTWGIALVLRQLEKIIK